ncbi:MAG: VCBS repeat-containing protein [Planctomycetota bacterium]
MAPAVPAQQLQFDFPGKRHLESPTYTQNITFQDLDGDGSPDLLLGTSDLFGTGVVDALLLNDGIARFTDATARLPINPDITTAIVVADFDGDGHNDLFLCKSQTDYQALTLGYNAPNRLFLSDGAGSFTDRTSSHLPAETVNTLRALPLDLDGDGDLDLVLDNNLPIDDDIYLNDGSGTFTNATATHLLGSFGSYPCPFCPLTFPPNQVVHAGDVDGDGDPDLIESTQGIIQLNDGYGRFARAPSSSLTWSGRNAESAAVSDVDGDGDPDLLFTFFASEPDRLYLNDGLGTFIEAPLGRLPAATALNSRLTPFDADGDGDEDLLAWGGSPESRLWLNDGTGTFVDAAAAARVPSFVGFPAGVTTADADGDGDLDLAVFVGGGVLRRERLLLNDGAGYFHDATATTFPQDEASTVALACVDVDADGDRDLVVGNFRNQNQLFLNDGAGNFAEVTTTHLPVDIDATFGLARCDVDRDGDSDLVVANKGQSKVYVNDGTGVFADETSARLPAAVHESVDVACGDVDGDGAADFVLANERQPSRLLLNDGTGVFDDVTTSRLPSVADDSNAVVLADVDGDGDLDLLLGNSNQNRLYQNDGTGHFVDVTATQLPIGAVNTSDLASLDFDEDGDLDLVLANLGQNMLLENNGLGQFFNVTAGRMPVLIDQSRTVIADDLDADGFVDLLFGNPAQTAFLRNDRSGNFVAMSDWLPAWASANQAIASCDVDRDGDLDFITGNGEPSLFGIPFPNQLLINLHRQLETPYLARLGLPFDLRVYARRAQFGSPQSAIPIVSTGTSRFTTPWGIFGLDPAQMVWLPAITLSPASTGSIELQIPAVPALAGSVVHAQAVFVSWPRLLLSNVTTDTIVP